jgi:hypothetical protein
LSRAGKYGVPPPSTTGLTNNRYSSIRFSSTKVEAKPAPPTDTCFSDRSLSFATSSTTPPLASLAFPSTFSSVVENTTFGMALQIRANSSC